LNHQRVIDTLYVPILPHGAHVTFAPRASPAWRRDMRNRSQASALPLRVS
jgi:hypothetical protein